MSLTILCTVRQKVVNVAGGGGATWTQLVSAAILQNIQSHRIFHIFHQFLSGHDFQNKTPAANSGSTAKHSRKC